MPILKHKIQPNMSGFTLLELLVVIAIIGILAGVVLLSVNNSRTEAISTAVQQELLQYRRVLQSDFLEQGTYRFGYVGSNSGSTSGWAKIPANCTNYSNTGNYQADYERLCQRILERTTIYTNDNDEAFYAMARIDNQINPLLSEGYLIRAVDPSDESGNRFFCYDDLGRFGIGNKTGTVGPTSPEVCAETVIN